MPNRCKVFVDCVDIIISTKVPDLSTRNQQIYTREADDAVDKLQAFYKVNPIEKVERTVRTSSEQHTSGQESKNNLEFHKVLLQYYNDKAITYQDSKQYPTNTYGKNAMETLYEGASTVNFFG